MKKCSRCKKEKETTEFYKNSSNYDKLSYWCKPCMLQQQIDARKEGYKPKERKKAMPKVKKHRPPKFQFIKRDWGTPHEYYVIKPKPTVHEKFSAVLNRLREQNRIVL